MLSTTKKDKVHFKNLILFYLLVIVCCDGAIVAQLGSAKLRHLFGDLKFVPNEVILLKNASKVLLVEILKSRKKVGYNSYS